VDPNAAGKQSRLAELDRERAQAGLSSKPARPPRLKAAADAAPGGAAAGGAGAGAARPWCLEERVVVPLDDETGDNQFRVHGLEVTPAGRILVAREVGGARAWIT
jgi:hypothetical protein